VSAMLIAINSLVFLAAAVVWNRDDGKNVCIKGVLWMLFICNAIEMMHVSGYIAKVHP
jgi:uncharacterized membrane protein YqhA